MGFNRLLYFSTVLCFLQTLLEGVVGVSCPTHVSAMKGTHTATYKDKCYLFVDKEVFWRTARDKCWDLGGEMLMVKDEGTMDFIKDTLTSNGWDRNGVWLGLSYHRKRWMWTDGSPMVYENWARGEPSNYLRILSLEECAQMRRDDNPKKSWQWYDHVCGGLKFHFNFICQFAAVVAHTTPTLTTPPKKNTTEDLSRMRGMQNDMSNVRGMQNDESDESNSSLYQRLGHDVYRLMTQEGMSSKSLIKLIQESAVSGKSPDAEPEQVTSRVSSSASNQQEDNGNMKIIIIIVSLSAGFLFILLIIFLLMWRHNRMVKAKAAERIVRYENNGPGMGGATGTTRPADPEEQRPPPIPATRPPPMDEMYLAPKDINGMYTEVLRPNGTAGHGSNHNNYHMVSTTPAVSNDQSSNGSEERSPLMSDHFPSNEHVHRVGTPSNSPTESCACGVSSGHDGSEYIAMNSLVSADNIRGSQEKMISPDDKHTYSNVNMEGKDNGVVENLYEALP